MLNVSSRNPAIFAAMVVSATALGGVALADTAPAWSSRPEAPATLLIGFDGIDYGSGT